ncbi:MAG TPA: hypothetical protein VIJ77_00010 [Candidatus Tumulicola sp.]|jgi:hypothetical protein
MLYLRYFGLAIAVGLAAAPMTLRAQGADTMSDSDYVAKVMTAAPAAVAKGATVVEMNADGTARTVQTGTNGFTCMLLLGTPACADKNAMAWMQSMMSHSAPPASVGFMYMLAGDSGASNTDPLAKAPTAGNHWVKTGPHVMILGPAAATMGYPMTADADASQPYVMWAGTPYAHLMIPVSSEP